MPRTIQEALPLVTDAIKGGVHKGLIWSCLVAEGMKPKSAEKVIEWAEQRVRADAEAIIVFINDSDVILEEDPNLPEGA